MTRISGVLNLSKVFLQPGMRQSLWREEVGEYIALARRHDDTWYIGVINGATPRHIEIDLSFIGNGPKKIKAHIDGVSRPTGERLPNNRTSYQGQRKTAHRYEQRRRIYRYYSYREVTFYGYSTKQAASLYRDSPPLFYSQSFQTVISSKIFPFAFRTFTLSSSFFFSRIITVAPSILYPPPIITG